MNLELLTRLDVAEKTGSLSGVLAGDLRQALLANMPASDRRLYRNQLYRQAATLLPAGKPWERAGQLAEIIKRWSGRPSNDPIRQYFYEMKLLGVNLLLSQERIHEALTKN